MTLTLTRTHERRMLKLCDFLEKLPRRSFCFDTIYEKRRCGTVACAIGWTPKLFPKLVRWAGTSVESLGKPATGYASVGAMLFGIPRPISLSLFSPCLAYCVHSSLPVLGNAATPKQVARMLRRFVRLAKEGRIEG